MWGQPWGSMLWGDAAEFVPGLSPFALGVLVAALLGFGYAFHVRLSVSRTTPGG